MPSDVQVVLTDADIAQAEVVLSNSRWQVAVTLTPDGRTKIATYTQQNVGHYLVIARDGLVLSSPCVNQPILDGRAVITGQFDANSAHTLAVQLRGGRLPFPLIVVEADETP